MRLDLVFLEMEPHGFDFKRAEVEGDLARGEIELGGFFFDQVGLGGGLDR
jgi:hypothetical protein